MILLKNKNCISHFRNRNHRENHRTMLLLFKGIQLLRHKWRSKIGKCKSNRYFKFYSTNKFSFHAIQWSNQITLYWAKEVSFFYLDTFICTWQKALFLWFILLIWFRVIYVMNYRNEQKGAWTLSANSLNCLNHKVFHIKEC